MSGAPRVGVLYVNFGEPREPGLEEVRGYLERIFFRNMDLEGGSADAVVARALQLAEARAPSLLAVYRAIGGSPLNDQAEAQAHALEAQLAGSGALDARVYPAFQFTHPSILDQVAAARADGVEILVVLPGYPLCGHSTTVASLAEVRRALRDLDWPVPLRCVSGWHDHPGYLELRVDNVRAFVRERGLDLTDADTLLYFSVHGTPVKYIERGSRYDRYVAQHTRAIARRLGVGDRYAVGFQNHTNRPIEWTQPDNERRLREVSERRLVVVPVAFMHEQSETLAELDADLSAFARGLGKEMHRVPVPHDDARFVEVLASLVEALACSGPGSGPRPPAGAGEHAGPGAGATADEGACGAVCLSPCRCAGLDGVVCTNGHAEPPPSPFVPAAARS
ncbi:MAG TPA: ferrochelatase [Longimicrobiales bacterium]|nr:ferrochelatase [Longimicrobiales bacterium]